MASSGETQYAVQLTGPDKLTLNICKKVDKPGRYQILCRVEAVGLCFSDLKLLSQFSAHARKGPVTAGIEPQVLEQIPSYVPCEAPTVPGHEAVVRIEAVGPDAGHFKRGRRYLVQTDYRWLRTDGSNAAFGYNFEGALQEYVLMDTRVITSPQGDSMLIPVSEELSASAVALIEPWACVEDAYASQERQSLKPAGRMLIVCEVPVSSDDIVRLFNEYGKPAKLFLKSATLPTKGKLNTAIAEVGDISELEDGAFDDVVYFGSNADTVEALFPKVTAKGLLNIVLCGGRFGRDVVTQVGRVHYGGIRVIGTAGCDPAESMRYIPRTGEIRAGERINVIGAAGPMGAMHVIRNICQGVKGVSVFAGDVDENRLAALTKIAEPLAEKNGLQYKPYNPASEQVSENFDYTVLMAPIPELVASSVGSAGRRGIINIFAGIPASVSARIDLDAYIEKQLYFIGTSGSVLDDMKRVLAKVEAGRLDTNLSVAAVCGLKGAIDGIRAIKNRSIAGKIMVYPACRELDLIPLEDLHSRFAAVAENLQGGLWTKLAEEKLLQECRVL